MKIFLSLVAIGAGLSFFSLSHSAAAGPATDPALCVEPLMKLNDFKDSKPWERGNYHQIMADTKWERHLDLQVLADKFIDKKGRVLWKDWEAFKKQQPGIWVKIPNGKGIAKNTRVIVLRSDAAKPSGSVKVFLGGIGYDIERYLTTNHNFIDKLDNEAHNVMIEKGGLTDLEAYFHYVENGEAVPYKLDVHDEAQDVYNAWVVTRELMRKNNLKVPDKMDLIALSAGGWLTEYMAANSDFNNLINAIFLMDPGARSLDLHYNKGLRHSIQFLNNMSAGQKPFVDLYNSWVASANQYTQIFSRMWGFPFAPKAVVPEMLTAIEQYQYWYSKSVDGAMAAMFDRLKKDKVRRLFATARVAGLTLVDGVEELKRVPHNVPVFLMFGGADDIVPPSLFGDMVHALQERGADLFAVIYIQSLEHDSPASHDPNVALSVDKLFDDKWRRGIWQVDQKSRVRLTEDQMRAILTAGESAYFDKQMALMKQMLERPH